MRLSLKQRLMAMITGLMTLLCLAGGVYIVARAQADIRGEVQSATQLVQRYLRAKLDVAELAWQRNNDLLPQLELNQLRDVRHVQVSFYARDGRLVDTSADEEAPASRAPVWFAWAVQHSLTPIPDSVRPIVFDGVHMGDIVIRPDPRFELHEIWSVARGLLGLLAIFCSVVSALIWWAVGRAVRPLRDVRDALRQLGAGDLHARLPGFDLPELSSLGAEFNRMADTLALSAAENRRLNRQLMRTQEDERTRIAHELHDELGQCIAAIHADAASIQHSQGAESPSVRESASAIVDAAGRVKSLLRGMLQRLRPAALDELGLEAALRELVAGFRQRNTDTTYRFAIDADAAPLRGEVAITAYRLVQEGLTNIARHAQARHVDVEIDMDTQHDGADRALRIVVGDDGRGFDVAHRASGYGLLGMRERVRALGGVLDIQSRADAGTRIRASLPASEAKEKTA